MASVVRKRAGNETAVQIGAAKLMIEPDGTVSIPDFLAADLVGLELVSGILPTDRRKALDPAFPAEQRLYLQSAGIALPSPMPRIGRDGTLELPQLLSDAEVKALALKTWDNAHPAS
jgi:hypothetical protein